MKRLLIVVAALCALAGRAAYAADPPGILNPVTILCPNAANTAYVACFGTSSSSLAVTTAPANSTGAYSAVAVGASSAQAVAAGAAKVFLDLKNESTTASIACAFGAVAALNTAGSFTLPPGANKTWEGSFVPADAVNCIASAGSTPLTIGAK